MDKTALIIAALVAVSGSASAQWAEDYRIRRDDWTVVVLKEVFGDGYNAYAESDDVRTTNGLNGAQSLIVCYARAPTVAFSWPAPLTGPYVSLNIRLGTQPVGNYTFMPYRADRAANPTLPADTTLIPASVEVMDIVNGAGSHPRMAFGPAAAYPLDAAIVSLRGFSSAMADMAKACSGTKPTQ